MIRERISNNNPKKKKENLGQICKRWGLHIFFSRPSLKLWIIIWFYWKMNDEFVFGIMDSMDFHSFIHWAFFVSIDIKMCIISCHVNENRFFFGYEREKKKYIFSQQDFGSNFFFIVFGYIIVCIERKNPGNCFLL